MATKHLQFRIEEELKNEAETILKNLWLDTPTVIRMLFRQIAIQRGIPFFVTESPYTFTKEKSEAFDRIYEASFSASNLEEDEAETEEEIMAMFSPTK